MFQYIIFLYIIIKIVLAHSYQFKIASEALYYKVLIEINYIEEYNNHIFKWEIS